MAENFLAIDRVRSGHQGKFLPTQKAVKTELMEPSCNNGLKLEEARFRLKIRKNFLTVRAVRQWTPWPQEVMSHTGGIQEKIGQPSGRSALIWMPALSKGMDWMVFKAPFNSMIL